jgi:hypothetical protein
MSYDCFCDYDAPEFYSSTIRTARKQHKCFECGNHIIAGDKYEYVFGKWGGDIGRYKTCSHCVDLRTWTHNNVPCLCWAHGNLFDDCLEAIEEAAWRAPKETGGLRFGFLRRVALRKRFYKQRAAETIK